MTIELTAAIGLLARYNRLANERLYAACAGLPEAELKRDRRAFFRSIHGTLNYILLGDRVWLGRFEGEALPSTSLDRILYEGFAQLHAARAAEDARLERFAARLTPAFLAGDLAYVNNEGREMREAGRHAGAAPVQSPDAPSRPGARHALPGRRQDTGAGHAPRAQSLTGEARHQFDMRRPRELVDRMDAVQAIATVHQQAGVAGEGRGAA